MAAIEKIKYVIIGNSAGGIGVAEGIRELDGSGPVAIVSDEPYPAYSRPLISEYLAHPYPIEKMAYRPADFYEKNRIRTFLGKKMARVIPEEHTVRLENGQALGWEKLLIATGGTPIRPETEGSDLKGVFTFNRLDDARAIDDFINRRRRRIKAAVIGGGLIGVSVTEALVRRGIDVVIIEMKDRVLNTILDEEASSLEAMALELAGVNIITGHTVVEINGNLAGEVNGITLDDRQLIHCEMVIVAIGVRPRLDSLAESGLKTNRGIIVDRYMRTSAPDIYACGDVSEAYDFVTGSNRLTPIWPNAYAGGRTAGLNMAGGAEEYAGGTSMNSLKYFGVHIVSAGLVMPPDTGYETISERYNGTYRKVILKDNKLAGMIYAGDIEKSGIVYNLMKDGVDVGGFKKALVAGDFGVAYLPEEIRKDRVHIPDEPETAAAGEDEVLPPENP